MAVSTTVRVTFGSVAESETNSESVVVDGTEGKIVGSVSGFLRIKMKK